MFIETLLAAAISLGGFTVNPPPPEVVEVTTEQMERLYDCKECSHIPQGMFKPEQPDKIFVQKGIPDGNTMEQSILLHELVHYLQFKQGKIRPHMACKEWLANEMEAFAVQEKWLVKQYYPTLWIHRIKGMYIQACEKE